MAPRLPGTDRQCIAGQTQDLPVPVQRASTRARFSDRAGSSGRLQITRPSVLPSSRDISSAPGMRDFHGSMAGPCAHLSTLRRDPHGSLRTTRCHRGLLDLRCSRLALLTPCRFYRRTPLPSIGITRLQRYYWPLRGTLGPAYPSRESGWPCDRPPREPSRVAPVFLFYACHRHYPGGIPGCSHRSLPQRRRPSPTYRRVGFHIPLFEACSTFTHVMACIFVKPPKVALCTGVLSSRLAPWAAAPITTGWSDFCRAGFAPAGRPCLCTAHGMTRGTSFDIATAAMGESILADEVADIGRYEKLSITAIMHRARLCAVAWVHVRRTSADAGVSGFGARRGCA